MRNLFYWCVFLSAGYASVYLLLHSIDREVCETRGMPIAETPLTLRNAQCCIERTDGGRSCWAAQDVVARNIRNPQEIWR